MGHIDTFVVDRFRGIRDLKLEDLGQINLFIGDNNSGKTSVLEALSIYSDPLNGRKWHEVASLREVLISTSSVNRIQRLNLVDRLTWLFPQQESDSDAFTIFLSAPKFGPLRQMSASYKRFLSIESNKRLRFGEQEQGKEVEVENISITIVATFSPDQPTLFEIDEFKEETLVFSETRLSSASIRSEKDVLAAQLISPFSHRLSSLQPQLWTKVIEADLKDSTLELLRSYDQRIQDIDLIFPQERQLILSVKHQQLGRAPLSTFGDGLRRIFTLATAIPRCRGGLLLIDELETAIHTKALRRTFEWLVNACIQNNVQLFATTHSLEAIDAVIDACKSDATNLVTYRLGQGETQSEVTRFDKGLLTRLREELGMEVR